MTQDPFERAVERVHASERAAQEHRREQVSGFVREGTRTAFRIHASVYLAVNLLLVMIWLTTTPGALFWPVYVILGWGIGLVAHWAATSRHMRRRGS